MRLMPGMVLCLAKSCEVMVVAEDDRPRQLALMEPADTNTEPPAGAGEARPAQP